VREVEKEVQEFSPFSNPRHFENFAEAGVDESLIEKLKQIPIDAPTAIQSEIVPEILQSLSSLFFFSFFLIFIYIYIL